MSSRAPDNDEYDILDSEREVIEAIRDAGTIPQSELWKRMGIRSSRASSLLGSLEEKGLVAREQIVHEGHRTYRIRLTDDAKKNPENLNYELLLAGDLLPPFIGDSRVVPDSDGFTQWLMSLDAEHRRQS